MLDINKPVSCVSENKFDEPVFECALESMFCANVFEEDEAKSFAGIERFDCVFDRAAATCANVVVSDAGAGASTKRVASCVLLVFFFALRLFFSRALVIVALYLARKKQAGSVALWLCGKSLMAQLKHLYTAFVASSL